MSSRTESAEHYQKALKAGKKAQKQMIHQGLYPHLPILDEILPDYPTAIQEELGIIEIPADKIVGTKTRGRADAFAANFMPLIPDKSEFAMKWQNLCQYHLGDSGIRDPIFCYEFLGRFYVQEGNKRVSVLKYFGAASITGKVIRIVPGESNKPEVVAYKEFLTYYPKTKLYEIAFSRLNSFPKLQAALGHEEDHVWTEEERRNFRSSFYYFNRAFEKLRAEPMIATPADALMEWLKIYPFDSIKSMSNAELESSLESIWPTVKGIGRENVIELNTKSVSSEDKAFKNRRAFSMMPSYLNIAFVHELLPENSNWVNSHHSGSIYMEECLGEQAVVQRFIGVGTGEEAERAMEIAIKNGAEVIFTTTAPMLKACRRVAARHPETKILNCSVGMPYTDVRTYYSRIYEGKFISGAIAGALSKSDTIGYIASYPILGVTAGINAFALGAQLTKLGNKGGCCPVTCYEYLGAFYIIDGAKRVSIAKCHGIPTITASVVRLMPVKTEDPVIKRYYDFVDCFEKTGLYQVAFTRPYSLERFQKALGFEPDYVWNDSDRLDFLFNWHIFELAFQEAYNGYLTITPADVFLVLLEDHPYEKLREMPPIVLIQLMRNVWDKLYAIQNTVNK